jgi:predicted transposase/invertase (TIGR01784 family)
MEKGMEKGIEKGMEEGEKKNAIETAGKMLKDNVPIESIIKYTGLTEELISKIHTQSPGSAID